MRQDRYLFRCVTLRKHHNTIHEALKRQVDGRARDHQAMDRQLVDADRQLRLLDVDLATPTVDSQAKASLQNHERSARGPGLRQTGYRVGDRRLSRRPLKAAEQLRQPHIEADRRLK